MAKHLYQFEEKAEHHYKLPSEFKLSRSKIMYIEEKSSGLEGNARIGRVYLSKTG